MWHGRNSKELSIRVHIRRIIDSHYLSGSRCGRRALSFFFFFFTFFLSIFQQNAVEEFS